MMFKKGFVEGGKAGKNEFESLKIGIKHVY